MSLDYGLHEVTHRHVSMGRGLEQLVICGPRRWWGWTGLGEVVVYYRPHRYAAWQRLTLERFRDEFPTMREVR